MSPLLLTFFTLVILGVVLVICAIDPLFKPRDYTKDYITKGLCPRCKFFDKYSGRCFASEKEKWSDVLGRTVYYSHTPSNQKTDCKDYDKG